MRRLALRRLTPIPIPLLLAVLLAGCDLALEPGETRNYEGYYTYTGRVDGTSRYNVVGAIRIVDQWRDEAYVTIDWVYREGTRSLLDIQSSTPARARIDSRGNIRFVFEGEFRHDGRWVRFELEHEGRLSGRNLTGDWWLWTSLHTDESGTFTARR
jgi:hypothetical protein